MDQTSPAPASFCPRCGIAVAPEDRFCRGCGFDFASPVSAPDTRAGGPEEASHWPTEPAYTSVPVSTGSPGSSAPVSAPVPEPVAPAVAKPGGSTGKIVAAIVAVAVVAAVALVLSGGIKTPLTTHTVPGTFVIMGGSSYIAASGSGCQGAGGFSDVQTGQPVTVKDEKGTILDATSLGSGTYGLGSCSFSFTVSVPDTASFYTFTVGRRGDVTYSHADMVSRGWTVGLSLNGS